MLDVVCKEFTYRVMVKLIESLAEKFDSQETVSYLNEYDEHGMALIHYLAQVNYHEAIKFIIEHGANVNLRSYNEQ